MSRIIRTESPARTRDKMVKTLAYAYQYYQQEKTTARQQRDICAFALFTLKALVKSIDQTASAWEKRNYWIKADQLRNTWEWTSRAYKEFQHALRNNDTAAALTLYQNLTDHFDSSASPKKGFSPALWQGAWTKWENAHY